MLCKYNIELIKTCIECVQKETELKKMKTLLIYCPQCLKKLFSSFEMCSESFVRECKVFGPYFLLLTEITELLGWISTFESWGETKSVVWGI